MTHARKKARRSSAADSFLDFLSTHFLICTEKIPGKGEDAGFESFSSDAGVFAVFDGCGGLGSSACSNAQGKTEAYLASRATANAMRLWFLLESENGCPWNTEALKKLIMDNLSVVQTHAGQTGPRMRGSLVRPFPSTIAAVAAKMEGGRLTTTHIWAGDSRTYVLDANGLAQISADDIRGEDAMSNLKRDGALTNLLSSDNRFTLHTATFSPSLPCILFSATDGCFGYVPSPMHFERMILENLMNARSAADWEKRLGQEISSCAGDDQTLALSAYGFIAFEEMRQFFVNRYMYIRNVTDAFDAGDEAGRNALWAAYKPYYYRYCNGQS